MSEIYWITRLDAIGEMLEAFTAISILCCICFGMAYLVTQDNPNIFKDAKKWFIGTLISSIVFGTSVCLTPTTYEALMIYGTGSALDYYHSNDKLQRLPDKFVNYLDSLIEKKLEGEK